LPSIWTNDVGINPDPNTVSVIDPVPAGTLEGEMLVIVGIGFWANAGEAPISKTLMAITIAKAILLFLFIKVFFYN